MSRRSASYDTTPQLSLWGRAAPPVVPTTAIVLVIRKIVFTVMAVLVMMPLVIVTVNGSMEPSSGTEATLRQQLAQAQAQIAETEKGRQQLAEAVAKLTAQAAQQAHVASVRSSAASHQRSAEDDAVEANAADARTAVLAAQVAENKANLDRINFRLQAAAIARQGQQNGSVEKGTLYTLAFGFLTLMAVNIWKWVVDGRQHKWLIESLAAAATKNLNAITEVKHSAQAAYDTANTVNEKLLAIGVKMADGKPLSPHESGT